MKWKFIMCKMHIASCFFGLAYEKNLEFHKKVLYFMSYLKKNLLKLSGICNSD